jgi:O-antigen/teichoic acid export membrane protein
MKRQSRRFHHTMMVDKTAGKWLPPFLGRQLSPVIDRLASILAGRSEEAVAERMALAVFAIRVGGAAIAFLSQIVLARVMGEFEYGVFVFVWAMAIILGNLSCFGFPTAVIRFLPGYRAEEAYSAIRGLADTARQFTLVSATSIAALGAALLYVAGDQVPGHYLVPLCLGLIIMPMIALGDVLDGTARANSWPVFGLGATFLLRPTLILVFMLLLVSLGFAKTSVNALWAALAATYATTILQYLAVDRRMTKRFASAERVVAFRIWLAFALPMFLIEGCYFLLTNSDVLVVGFYLPPDQVGIYFAAAKTMALVHFVYFAVKAAAAPRFAALVAADDKPALALFARQTVIWTFWPSLLLGGVVLAAAPLLLALFGPAFQSGQPVMTVLFIGIMAKALVGPGEVLLTMAGEQTRTALIYLTVLVVNIVLNITLIPRYGLVGAAAATATAMGTEALLLNRVVRFRLGISMFIIGRSQAGSGGAA